MSILLDKLMTKREYWTQIGFTAGQMVIDFVYMFENNLDMYFDKDNLTVCSYKKQLSKLLGSDNEHLMLMVHCEAEKSIGGSKYDNLLYSKLGDEAYSHYIQFGESYPLECLDFHICILYGLLAVDDIKKFEDYFYGILATYRENFDDNKFLWNRNKLYIIYRFLCVHLPEFADDMFKKEKNNFVDAMKENALLYYTRICIAGNKVKKENNLYYLKEAIKECEQWINECERKDNEICVFLHLEKGIYFRDIGEIKSAVSEFEKVIKLSDFVPTKRFALAQIASLYYVNNSWELLDDLLDENSEMYRKNNESDENVAYLYGIEGLLRAYEGNRTEALENIDIAVDVAQKLVGQDGELVVIMRNNESIVYWILGDYSNAQQINYELMDIIKAHPEKYPEAITLVINNNLIFEGYMGFEKNNIMITKRLLIDKKTPYDAVTSYPLKSNLFLFKKIGECEDCGNEHDALYEELDMYYSKHKNENGYFQFLRGAVIKFSKKKNREKEIFYLNEILDYVNDSYFEAFSVEDFIAIQARIKLLEYSNNQYKIDKYIDILWKERIIPLLYHICRKEYKNEAFKSIILSNSYMSLIISICKYYHRLQDEILYKYVVNYKHILEKIQKNETIWREIGDLNSINFSIDYLVVDTFEYRYIDFGNPLYLVSMDGMNINDVTHKLFFAVTCEGHFIKHCKVQVLFDVSINTLCKIVDTLAAEDTVSNVNNRIVKKINSFLDNKKRSYVCDDMILTKYIAKLLTVSEDLFLCQQIPIIFCSNILNVVDDIEIRDVSNAYVFGKAQFIQSENSDESLQDYLTDIPYSEREVQTIGKILGCGVNPLKFNMEVLEKSNCSIIHFSTHTVISKDGNAELVIDEDNADDYITLGYDEISSAKWDNVDLVVLSACNTGGITEYGDHDMTLEKAVYESKARSCISTLFEVADGVNAFFMTCFYKELKKTNRVIESYINALNTMYLITKREILQDQDYKKLGMEQYLKEYAFDEQPFNGLDDFSAYILDIY